MPRSGRIEICGGIASGKTTLVSLLEDAGIQGYFEQFESNPFFHLFYADRENFSFEAEITFLLQHVGAIKTSQHEKLAAFDFSLALDLAYAMTTLAQSDQSLFVRVLRRALTQVPPANLIVRLRCSPLVAIERIKARGRLVEQTVTVQYLETIEQNIDTTLFGEWFPGVSILELDSAMLDFREEEPARLAVQEILSKVIS